MSLANLNFPLEVAGKYESEAYKQEYPDLDYPLLCPIITNVDPRVQSITTIGVDGRGEAEFTSTGLDASYPTADFDAKEVSIRMHHADIGYTVSRADIESAMLGVFDPIATKADHCVEAFHRFMQKSFLTGHDKIGSKGLTNTTGIATTNADKTFQTMTAKEAYQAIVDVLIQVSEQTKGRRKADTLLMPLGAYHHLRTKIYDTNESMSVLQALRRAEQDIKGTSSRPVEFVGSPFLANDMIAYSKDRKVLRMFLPMGLQFLPQQPRGSGYLRPGIFKASPLQILNPYAMHKVTGVA